MQLRKAFYAGLNGALAMTVLMGLIPFTLLPHNLGLLTGSLVLREISLAAWALGLVLHLAAGGTIALGYVYLFDRVLGRSGWKPGLLIGAAQAVVVGPTLGLIPLIHPLVPSPLPAPGMYLSQMGGLGVVAFFTAHLAYGLIVGAVYADLPQVAPRRRTTQELPARQ